MSDAIINAPKPFWHDPAGPPEDLIRRPPGIMVRLAPGVDKFGPATIAQVEFAVAERYDRQYGGTARGATVVAAIDMERGGVYARSPYSNHAVPISLSMQPEKAGAPGERLGRTTMATAFNVDLGWHLELPPGRGKYCVFVWIDETVSEARVATIEPPAKRFSMPAAPAKPEKGSAVTFSPGSGAGGNKALTCEAPPEKWEKRRLNGRIVTDLLAGGAPGKEPRRTLSILVLDHLTRKVGSESVLLPEKAGPIVNFTVDVDGLVRRMPDAGRGRVFVIAHIEGNITPVMVFEPPPGSPKPPQPPTGAERRA